MKTPFFLTFAFLVLPIAVQARDLFNAPVHLGSGNTNNNGQAVHGSVPRSTSTVVKKPKTTTVPYDAEQMPDTPKEPSTVTTKQGTTITTEAYAPPPPEPTPEPTPTIVPATPIVPSDPSIADAPAAPTVPATPAVTTPATTPAIVVTDPLPTTPQPTTTSPEPAPLAVERAAPPPAVQLLDNTAQNTEPAKTTADNSSYADKMFDAIKSMLGQKTQPIDESLIRDEK